MGNKHSRDSSEEEVEYDEYEYVDLRNLVQEVIEEEGGRNISVDQNAILHRVLDLLDQNQGRRRQRSDVDDLTQKLQSLLLNIGQESRKPRERNQHSNKQQILMEKLYTYGSRASNQRGASQKRNQGATKKQFEGNRGGPDRARQNYDRRNQGQGPFDNLMDNRGRGGAPNRGRNQNKGRGDYHNKAAGEVDDKCGEELPGKGRGQFHNRGRGDYQNRGREEFQNRGRREYQNRGQQNYQAAGTGEDRALLPPPLFPPNSQQHMFPNQGQGNVPYQGQGNVRYQGQGNIPYQGQGNIPYQGQGNVPYQGQGNVPYQGQGNLPYQGQGNVPYQGQGNVPYQGQGNVPYQGLGNVPYQGQGNVPYQGQGNVPYQGQGNIAYRGNQYQKRNRRAGRSASASRAPKPGPLKEASKDPGPLKEASKDPGPLKEAFKGPWQYQKNGPNTGQAKKQTQPKVKEGAPTDDVASKADDKLTSEVEGAVKKKLNKKKPKAKLGGSMTNLVPVETPSETAKAVKPAVGTAPVPRPRKAVPQTGTDKPADVVAGATKAVPLQLFVGSGFKEKEADRMDALTVITDVMLVAKDAGSIVTCTPKTLGDLRAFKQLHPSAEVIVVRS